MTRALHGSVLILVVGFVVGLGVLAGGCTTPSETSERTPGDQAVQETAPATATAPAESPKALAVDEVRPAPLWQREGFEAQPRQEELVRQTPPEMEFEPGTTAWRPSQRELAQKLRASSPKGPQSPGALLLQVIEALDLGQNLGRETWEMTTRIWSFGEGRVEGLVMLWGFKDDALAGSDLKVTMGKGDESWFVESLEERFHCRRGVSGDLCL